MSDVQIGVRTGSTLTIIPAGGGAEVETIANAAKAAAEAAKSSAETALKSVTELETKAEQGVTDSATAITSATEAKNLATTANTNANNANTTAQAAQTAAGEAKTTAQAAQSAANTAQTTATEAKNLATTANTNASNANTTAQTAQTTAGEAKTTATAAQTTANAAKAKADTSVQLTGNQTIAGVKTFNSDELRIKALTLDLNTTPSESQTQSIAYQDKNGGYISLEQHTINPDGSTQWQKCAHNNSNNANVWLGVKNTGDNATSYAYCNGTPANASGSEIATAKFVGDKINSLKSDAINSDNSNTLATSKAVKTVNDVANAAKAKADTSVQLTGDQTIAGRKSFTRGILLHADGTNQSSNPKNNAFQGAYIFDGSGKIDGANRLGLLQSMVTPSGDTQLAIASYKWGENTTESTSIQLNYPATGEPYATAPTTPANASGNEIATAKFVGDKINSLKSDAINSDNSNTLATSKAVKTVNDVANAAKAKADTSVQLTGDQTMNGMLTVSKAGYTGRHGGPSIRVVHAGVQTNDAATPGVNNRRDIVFVAEDGSTVSALLSKIAENTTTMSMQLRGVFGSKQQQMGIYLNCYENGDKFIYLNDLVPTDHNAGGNTVGIAAARWEQVYAKTATINTSDVRDKQQIESYTDAELDAWGEVELRKFLFNDSVSQKGENARIHAGMIAQQIMEAFAKHGLDASRYGFFCYDQWEAKPAQYSEAEYSEPVYSEEEWQEAVYDEDGNEISPRTLIKEREIIEEAKIIKERELLVPGIEAGDRYSLRYEECLCIEAASQRRRADRSESRLARVEAKLADLEKKISQLLDGESGNVVDKPSQNNTVAE